MTNLLSLHLIVNCDSWVLMHTIAASPGSTILFRPPYKEQLLFLRLISFYILIFTLPTYNWTIMLWSIPQYVQLIACLLMSLFTRQIKILHIFDLPSLVIILTLHVGMFIHPVLELQSSVLGCIPYFLSSVSLYWEHLLILSLLLIKYLTEQSSVLELLPEIIASRSSDFSLDTI